MRSTVLSIAAWLGALQAVAPPALLSVEGIARLLGIASVLGSLTVLVYRLGVWRQQMESTRESVGTEMKVFREELVAGFDRMERRLDRLETGRSAP